MNKGTRSTLALVNELNLIRKGRFPAFLTARGETGGIAGLPVFVYHTIEPEEFEEDLEFLTRNGYGTVTTEEYHEMLMGSRPARDDVVLLTIDDGRQSVWTHGLPLLKKYNIHATVFLIPGYVGSGQLTQPTLADAWDDQCSFGDIPTNDPALMNWKEIRTARQSGLVDFQSHTLYHHRIPSNPGLTGFYGPADSTALFDVPLPPGYEPVMRDYGPSSLWGMPLFHSSPLMTGHPGFLPDPSVIEECLSRVSAGGKSAFFDRRNWRRELWRGLKGSLNEGRFPGRFQTERELKEQMLRELRESRRIIEEKLPGHTVRHLCYPYGEGSDLAVELSRVAGYVSNFWVLRDDRSCNRPGEDDPFRNVRVKGDYLQRLPGRGRKSLREILFRKVVRRLQGGPVH